MSLEITVEALILELNFGCKVNGRSDIETWQPRHSSERFFVDASPAAGERPDLEEENTEFRERGEEQMLQN